MITITRVRAGEYRGFVHGERVTLLKRKGLTTGVFWVARRDNGETLATDDLLSGLRAKLSKIPTPKLPSLITAEASPEVQELRAEYAAILKRSGLDAKTFNALAGGILAKGKITAPTPLQHVEAARKVEVDCPACAGTGKHYSGGAVVNGKYTGKVGNCYRCNGKGKQNDADRRRNWGYDTKHRTVAA
jgi:hypothetical protein